NCRVGAWPYPTYKIVAVRSRHLTPFHYYTNTPFTSGPHEPQFVPQTSLTPTAAAELKLSLINK
ncbi:hypothetical protein, partial [Enterobacter intestinihominis]